MKSVTEFPNHKLAQGITTKASLAAAGKTDEEVQAAMGETFKLEGDKLKIFLNAVDIASKTAEKIFRIKIVKLNEGQNPPPKGTVVDELCYITELQTNLADLKKAKEQAAESGRGGKVGGKGGGRDGRAGGKGKGGGRPKESPWGISPEEKAAKKAASLAAAKAKA